MAEKKVSIMSTTKMAKQTTKKINVTTKTLENERLRAQPA